MTLTRRDFLLAAGGVTAAITLGAPAIAETRRLPMDEMYGLIGQMIAAPGQRDALIAILLEGTAAMPGCLSYIIASDPANADAIWITEVWDSKASHAASLSLPGVKDAIAKGRPMIAGFGSRTETVPVGGHGMAPGRAG